MTMQKIKTNNKSHPIMGLLRTPGFQAYFMLGVILFILIDIKYFYNISQTYPNIDGSYYTDIAQHVRDGDGIKTDVSLYHQAFEYFPHPTSIYPLWPWIYGMTARMFTDPILTTGINLATLFFFFSLIFGYLWAKRVFPEPIFPKTLPGFNAGHVFILMLSCHTEYFYFTSQPYTEGIGYALLLAGCWRFSHLFKRGGIAAGLEVGIWLGVMYLARYQLIIATMAALPALLGACFWHNNRKLALKMLIAAIASFMTIIGMHYLRIYYLMPASREMLSKFHELIQTDSIISYLIDRGKGFLVAFSFHKKYSYTASYFYLQYALIAAIIVMLFNIRKDKIKDIVPSICRYWKNPNSTFILFVILFSIGGWLSIHTIHKDYFAEWNFARRQGLTCIFIFFLAMMYLLRHKNRWIVSFGLILLLSTAYNAYLQYSAVAHEAKRNEVRLKAQRLMEKPPGNEEIAKFLIQQRNKRKKLTVVWTDPTVPLMAPYIPDVGFHWIYPRSTLEDVIVMFDELGSDYLLFDEDETRNWKFREKPKNLMDAFIKVKKLSGVDVFVRRKGK